MQPISQTQARSRITRKTGETYNPPTLLVDSKLARYQARRIVETAFKAHLFQAKVTTFSMSTSAHSWPPPVVNWRNSQTSPSTSILRPIVLPPAETAEKGATCSKRHGGHEAAIRTTQLILWFQCQTRTLVYIVIEAETTSQAQIEGSQEGI